MAELQADVIDTIRGENENQWNHVVEQSELGTLFHRYEWLLACEETLERGPRHVVVRKGNNPVGVFPNFRRPISVDGLDDWTEQVPVKKLVSTNPGAGGPVILTDERAVLEQMVDALARTNAPDVLYHTVRTNELGHARYSKAFREAGYECRLPSCRFRLDLRTGWETIRANMHKSRRQGVQRAEDAGVEVRTAELDGEAMTKTHEQHATHMDRIGVDHRLPPAFLRRLRESLDDRVVVFVAECDGEEVGRYLHLLDDERSSITYYLAGIPTEAALDRHAPEALHAAAIRWGQDHGYDHYDFGETKVGLDSGVFQFKRRFGADLRPTLSWQKGFSRVGWTALKLARDLYQRRKR